MVRISLLFGNQTKSFFCLMVKINDSCSNLASLEHFVHTHNFPLYIKWSSKSLSPQHSEGRAMSLTIQNLDRSKPTAISKDSGIQGWVFGSLHNLFRGVVYFDQLLGVAHTQKLVKLLLQQFSTFFVHF